MRKLKNILHLFEAILANIYFRFPSRKIKLIGVTGTDGKTTTVLMIHHILQKAGIKVGYNSTIGYDIGGKRQDQGFHVTTPGSLKLQSLIDKAAKNKLDYLVLEVSSHGLDQYRLYGCNFQVGVITNVTPEHLDYHQTYKNYLKAKAKLFKLSKIKILNKSDKSFSYLSKMFPDAKPFPFKNYGFKESYNNQNASAAAAVCCELGIDEKTITKAMKNFKFPEGRKQIVQEEPFRVIIDFAHTPNGLEKFLSSLDKGEGRLIHVFGSAGERDNFKRPQMGEAAAIYDDVIILTAEDPRSEKVKDINSAITKGIKSKKFKGKLFYEEDRAKAIALGIKIAQAGDTVVITGKGPEKSMNIGGVEYPWSDYKEVKKSTGAMMTVIINY
jgi:UDP-N-acetylmuramoyl-L-alanyl-D-glutamate--2,6-diaminopimelate ligase